MECNLQGLVRACAGLEVEEVLAELAAAAYFRTCRLGISGHGCEKDRETYLVVLSSSLIKDSIL